MGIGFEMSEVKRMTIDEQIAKATARLSGLKAKKAESSRKKRNGELIAIGIIIENQFDNAPDEVKEWLAKAAMSQSDARTKKMALSAIERLNSNPCSDEDGGQGKQDEAPEKRTYLNVPFEEKDQAKVLGARFDSQNKKWFIIEGEVDSAKFSKWM